ncbi:MAG TPA: hypothetical protein ENI45_05420, partial [Thermoplasmatales archaeon]|nr:hypothetical protein [Thermoplasmatales archaeon]
VKPGKPVGPVNGTVRKECSYTSVGFDIDGDDLYFMFDWGDGTSSGWQGPYKSGENITLQHSWNRRKTYNIRVKAIDDPNGDGDLSDGVESEWSDPLAVSMPRGKQLPTTFYIKLLENIVKKFPFLKHLLNIHDPPNFPFYTPDLPRFSVEPSTSKDGGYNPNSGSRAKIEECTITIEVHIALYGEWINKASDDWIKTLKDKIEKDIESKWNRDQWDKNGDGKPDGEQPWRVKCKKGCPKDEPGCVVKFDAEVVGKKNVSSKDLPTGGKAKSKKAEGYHWVHVADPRRPQSAHVNAWDSKLPTPNDGSETTGAFNVNDYAGVYAHEAGHLWGLKDQQKEIEREVNGKKVKYKYPSKKNEDGTWNIMAWPGGWPSQADIDEIVKNSGIECPCKCCPEENDTKKPKVKITEPTNNSKVPFSQPQHIIGYASDDESGVAELDYLLEWDGGSYDGASIFIDPPENHVDFTLGPIVPDDFVDPDDNWLKITIFATDAAGNTGSDSVTILRLEEDTTPPFTEKEIGEPKEEGGYIIWPSTPIWLNATDEESGVNHIYYQIAWDIDEDGTWDEFFEETVYGDTAEIQLQYWGITYGKIELRWYAVDNAENTEEMHYQQHLVATW